MTPEDVNPACKPHVRAIVPWMVGLGRAACFSRFGLQKTVTQLEAVRLTRERSGGRGLIVCPLGVRQEFRRDAVERLGWKSFGGLMTVPYCAIKLRRQARAVELSPRYFADGVAHCAAAARAMATPTLFDLFDVDAESEPALQEPGA